MCVYVNHSFFTMNWSFVGHSSSFELPRGRAILVGEALPCAAEQDMVWGHTTSLIILNRVSFCELEALLGKVGERLLKLPTEWRYDTMNIADCNNNKCQNKSLYFTSSFHNFYCLYGIKGESKCSSYAGA